MRGGTIPYLYVLTQLVEDPERGLRLDHMWRLLFNYFESNRWDLFPSTDRGVPWAFRGMVMQSNTPKTIFYFTSPPPPYNREAGGAGLELQRPITLVTCYWRFRWSCVP